MTTPTKEELKALYEAVLRAYPDKEVYLSRRVSANTDQAANQSVWVTVWDKVDDGNPVASSERDDADIEEHLKDLKQSTYSKYIKGDNNV